MKCVIDSSAIIGLAKVGLLEFLRNYDFVVSEATYNEVTVLGKPYSRIIADILRGRVLYPRNRDLVDRLSRKLGLGESETIVLALELNAIAIIDDLLARKLARRLGVKVKGLLWILLDKKERGHLHRVKPILDRLISEKFRISQKLYKKVLELAKEHD